MEKKYPIKYLDVLYYEGKVLPVRLEFKNGKKYLKFILGKSTLEINDFADNLQTYNNAARDIVLLISNDKVKKYGEIGTLTSAVFAYGNCKLFSKYPSILNIYRLINHGKYEGNVKNSQMIREYFDTELTEAEIADLFNNIQRGYEDKRSEYINYIAENNK